MTIEEGDEAIGYKNIEIEDGEYNMENDKFKVQAPLVASFSSKNTPSKNVILWKKEEKIMFKWTIYTDILFV